MEPLLKILSDKCQSLYFLVFNTHFNFFYLRISGARGSLKGGSRIQTRAASAAMLLVLKSQAERALQNFGSKLPIFHLAAILLGIKSCRAACGRMLFHLGTWQSLGASHLIIAQSPVPLRLQRYFRPYEVDTGFFHCWKSWKSKCLKQAGLMRWDSNRRKLIIGNQGSLSSLLLSYPLSGLCR